MITIGLLITFGIILLIQQIRFERFKRETENREHSHAFARHERRDAAGALWARVTLLENDLSIERDVRRDSADRFQNDLEALAQVTGFRLGFGVPAPTWSPIPKKGKGK